MRKKPCQAPLARSKRLVGGHRYLGLRPGQHPRASLFGGRGLTLAFHRGVVAGRRV